MGFQTGFTLRFSGVSGARKTALSRSVAEILRNRGYRVQVLEGNEFGQSDGLAFSKEDRVRKQASHRVRPNLISDNGGGAISRSVREEVHRQTQDVGAFVTCSLKAVIQRDTKGVRFTQMVLSEGLRRVEPNGLLDTPFRTIRNYQKRSLRHGRGGLRDHRYRPRRSGRTADRVKLGFTIQAVRQNPGASMS